MTSDRGGRVAVNALFLTVIGYLADHEPEPVSYSPGLRLRAIRFIDENTLEYDFEGICAADETFRLARSNDSRLGIWIYNFDQDYEQLKTEIRDVLAERWRQDHPEDRPDDQ